MPLAAFLIYGLFTVIKFHWTLPAWDCPVANDHHGTGAPTFWPGTTAIEPPARSDHESLGRRPVITLDDRLRPAAALPDTRPARFENHRFRQRLTWDGNRPPRPFANWKTGSSGETGQRPIIAPQLTSGAEPPALAWHYRPDGFDHITGQNLIGNERLDVGILVRSRNLIRIVPSC